MSEKSLVRDQDKFMLRLPEGMRERIKYKAQRAGMSMNEAIVWCLEKHFPATTTIEAKLDELAELVSILKGDNTYDGVDRLISEVRKTITEVGADRVKASPDFEELVTKRYEQWQEWEAERINEDAYDPFNDDNYPGFPSDEEIQAYAQQRDDFNKKTARMIEIAKQLEADEKAKKSKK